MSEGLEDAINVSYMTWNHHFAMYSRLFSNNCLPSTSELYTAPKLPHVEYSFSQSGPFHKALVIKQKSKLGQKKLALNKT